MKLYDRESLKCCKYIYFGEFSFVAAEAGELRREKSGIALPGTVHDIFSCNKSQRDAQFLRLI
jgi:hypothetical protein